ncbi:MAG: protein-L-isoaspartate O-methyltransferase family protein, partial [Magnetospiraceae bacterium]
MCGTVISVDSDAALAKRASKTLADLGIDNCVVIDSDLSQGNAKQGPYDGIFIAGGLPRVPAPIVDQLAEDGRLVYVRAGEEAVGRAMLMMREGGLISERDLFDAGTPMLPGFAPEPVFTF